MKHRRWHGQVHQSIFTSNFTPENPQSITAVILQTLYPNQSHSHTLHSYDGHPWEGVYPEPLEPVCTSAGVCTATLDTRYVYRVDATHQDEVRVWCMRLSSIGVDAFYWSTGSLMFSLTWPL